MRSRCPDHQIDDVTGLFHNDVAGTGAVEVPRRLARQVAAIAIGLQEQHLADASLLDKFHGRGAIRLMPVLETLLENPLGCASGIGDLAAILWSDRHRSFAIHVLANLE